MAPSLSAHLSRLGWSNRELARRLGVAESTTRAWREPPAAVMEWLASIVVPEAPRL
jgi:lambda repressor-like predicted transcriptional regulator